jgi:hypothetical protein
VAALSLTSRLYNARTTFEVRVASRRIDSEGSCNDDHQLTLFVLFALDDVGEQLLRRTDDLETSDAHLNRGDAGSGLFP